MDEQLRLAKCGLAAHLRHRRSQLPGWLATTIATGCMTSSSSPSHGDGDLAADVTIDQVPDGRGNIAEGICPIDDRLDRAGLDKISQGDQVGGVLRCDEGAQFLANKSDRTCACSCRSVPPSHRPSVSPPTMTSLPLGVRARRRWESRRLPPISRMTS